MVAPPRHSHTATNSPPATTSTSTPFTSRHHLQLFITQLRALLVLVLEPIGLAHVKACLLHQRLSGIKVFSALNLLPEIGIL